MSNTNFCITSSSWIEVPKTNQRATRRQFGLSISRHPCTSGWITRVAPFSPSFRRLCFLARKRGRPRCRRGFTRCEHHAAASALGRCPPYVRSDRLAAPCCPWSMRALLAKAPRVLSASGGTRATCLCIRPRPFRALTAVYRERSRMSMPEGPGSATLAQRGSSQPPRPPAPLCR
jgi:hypothetical protein